MRVYIGTDLTCVNLAGAKFTATTRWPEGFDPLSCGAILVQEEEEGSFAITFEETLSPAEVKCALTALADFYRACGGVGLEVLPEFEEVVILRPEPVYA